MKALTLAALALLIIGLIISVVQPFPTPILCGQTCAPDPNATAKIFGVNANVFASVAFFAIGAIVLIMSRQRRGR